MLGPLETLLAGLRAPIIAALRPREAFEEIGDLARRYGIYFTAAFSLGAWIGASMITFILVMLIEAARSIVGLDVIGFFTSPLTALKVAVAFPVIAAFIDATLIAVVALFSPRDRPLHAVYVVRASSLLPYSLRAAVLALEGKAGIIGLVTLGHGLVSILLLALGVALTAYGLWRSMGMPVPHSVMGALAPLSYKLILSL